MPGRAKTQRQLSCSSTPMDGDVKSVVVVGGGFAGRAALHELSRGLHNCDTPLNVTLVDRAPFSEFTPAVLRCFLDPGRLSNIISPHSIIEPKATFLHACVTDLSGGEITYTSGALSSKREKLPFDFCIWAAGSSYTFPIGAPPGKLVCDVEERRAQIEQFRERILASSSISLVGAGPVGVELAAELASMQKANLLSKDSKIRIHVRPTDNGVLPGFAPSARRYADKWLRRAGIDVTTSPPGDTGLCIPCTGNTPSLPRPNFRSLNHAKGLVLHAAGASAIDAMTAGRMAARGVLRLAKSNDGEKIQLRNSIEQAMLRRRVQRTKVAIISLGDYDAILCAPSVMITGIVPALIKRVVEILNVQGARGNRLSAWAARQSSAISEWLSKFATRVERRLQQSN